MDERFCGFSREVPQFFFELPFKNTIEDQPQNIAEYKTLLSEPLRLLYEELCPTAQSISPDLCTKRAKCVSSPYTDRRMSPAAPLKTYVYLRFKTDGRDENIPSLFFDMGEEGYAYGIRIYHLNTAGMAEIRKGILADMGSFSAALEKAEKKGFEVRGEMYKRDHYPQITDETAKKVLNIRHFKISKQCPFGEEVFSEELADVLRQGFLDMKELLLLIEKYI